MKKVLLTLGAIFLVLLVIVAGFIGYAAYQGRGLDESSKQYVENNVPPILSTWSEDELIKRSSPQLLEAVNKTPDEFAQLFVKLRQLGKFKGFTDIQGQSNVSITSQEGKVTTAAYVGSAKFEHGEGKISVRLILSPAEEWQLLYFHVDSPIFLK